MATRKNRIKSGWVTPKIVNKIPKEEMINKALEPQPYYDDWNNYRDGQRDKAYHEWKKRDKLKRKRRLIKNLKK